MDNNQGVFYNNHGQIYNNFGLCGQTTTMANVNGIYPNYNEQNNGYQNIPRSQILANQLAVAQQQIQQLQNDKHMLHNTQVSKKNFVLSQQNKQLKQEVDQLRTRLSQAPDQLQQQVNKLNADNAKLQQELKELYACRVEQYQNATSWRQRVLVLSGTHDFYIGPDNKLVPILPDEVNKHPSHAAKRGQLLMSADPAQIKAFRKEAWYRAKAQLDGIRTTVKAQVAAQPNGGDAPIATQQHTVANNRSATVAPQAVVHSNNAPNTVAAQANTNTNNTPIVIDDEDITEANIASTPPTNQGTTLANPAKRPAPLDTPPASSPEQDGPPPAKRQKHEPAWLTPSTNLGLLGAFGKLGPPPTQETGWQGAAAIIHDVAGKAWKESLPKDKTPAASSVPASMAKKKVKVKAPAKLKASTREKDAVEKDAAPGPSKAKAKAKKSKAQKEQEKAGPAGLASTPAAGTTSPAPSRSTSTPAPTQSTSYTPVHEEITQKEVEELERMFFAPSAEPETPRPRSPSPILWQTPEASPETREETDLDMTPGEAGQAFDEYEAYPLERPRPQPRWLSPTPTPITYSDLTAFDGDKELDLDAPKKMVRGILEYQTKEEVRSKNAEEEAEKAKQKEMEDQQKQEEAELEKEKEAKDAEKEQNVPEKEAVPQQEDDAVLIYGRYGETYTVSEYGEISEAE